MPDRAQGGAPRSLQLLELANCPCFYNLSLYCLATAAWAALLPVANCGIASATCQSLQLHVTNSAHILTELERGREEGREKEKKGGRSGKGRGEHDLAWDQGKGLKP